MPLIPLPNNGIEPSMYEPQGIDHLYPDPDVNLSIRLIVVLSLSSNPADNHWMVVWTVSDDAEVRVIRRLQIVQEISFDHLTNWGPITVTADDATKTSPSFSLGELTLSQRKDFEVIAQETPVMMPNGEWNCQHWTADLLKKAVEQNLLVGTVVENAIAAARIVSS